MTVTTKMAFDFLLGSPESISSNNDQQHQQQQQQKQLQQQEQRTKLSTNLDLKQVISDSDNGEHTPTNSSADRIDDSVSSWPYSIHTTTSSSNNSPNISYYHSPRPLYYGPYPPHHQYIYPHHPHHIITTTPQTPPPTQYINFYPHQASPMVTPLSPQFISIIPQHPPQFFNEQQSQQQQQQQQQQILNSPRYESPLIIGKKSTGLTPQLVSLSVSATTSPSAEFPSTFYLNGENNDSSSPPSSNNSTPTKIIKNKVPKSKQTTTPTTTTITSPSINSKNKKQKQQLQSQKQKQHQQQQEEPKLHPQEQQPQQPKPLGDEVLIEILLDLKNRKESSISLAVSN